MKLLQLALRELFLLVAIAAMGWCVVGGSEQAPVGV
jgi:hypothetical protein